MPGGPPQSPVHDSTSDGRIPSARPRSAHGCHNRESRADQRSRRGATMGSRTKPSRKERMAGASNQGARPRVGGRAAQDLSAADQDAPAPPRTTRRRLARGRRSATRETRRSAGAPPTAIAGRNREASRTLNLRPHEAVGGSYRGCAGLQLDFLPSNSEDLRRVGCRSRRRS